MVETAESSRILHPDLENFNYNLALRTNSEYDLEEFVKFYRKTLNDELQQLKEAEPLLERVNESDALIKYLFSNFEMQKCDNDYNPFHGMTAERGTESKCVSDSFLFIKHNPEPFFGRAFTEFVELETRSRKTVNNNEIIDEEYFSISYFACPSKKISELRNNSIKLLGINYCPSKSSELIITFFGDDKGLEHRLRLQTY